jgi:hypothetical protein
MLAEPIGFDGDVAFHGLGDLVQHRTHIEMQRGALVVGQ